MPAPDHDIERRRALTMVDQLDNLAAAVRRPRPLNAVIELVIAQISDIVPAEAAAVWMYDARTDRWYIGGARGLTRRASEVSFRSDQTRHARVGDQGEILHNLSSAGFRRLYPEHDLIRGVLYAPMTIAGRRAGLIALYRNTAERFTEDDLRFVRTVGSHVGMAISFAALEARAERAAVLEERARLGADLHDGILQILSSVQVYVSELRASLGALNRPTPVAGLSAVEEVLTQLERCVQGGSHDIVTAIEHLRQPQPSLDITSHVEMMRRRLEERGIRSDVTCDVQDIAADVADTLSWILREAGSNILQHSLANRVRIDVRQTGDEVTMTVADDGIGATAPTGEPRRGSDLHLGRRIMRERAAHVGGDLRVTRSQHGTTVRVRLPAVPVTGEE
jgi:nitrate/nitrite-specific signal transduction histidine kinase